MNARQAGDHVAIREQLDAVHAQEKQACREQRKREPIKVERSLEGAAQKVVVERGLFRKRCTEVRSRAPHEGGKGSHADKESGSRRVRTRSALGRRMRLARRQQMPAGSSAPSLEAIIPTAKFPGSAEWVVVMVIGQESLPPRRRIAPRTAGESKEGKQTTPSLRAKG